MSLPHLIHPASLYRCMTRRATGAVLVMALLGGGTGCSTVGGLFHTASNPFDPPPTPGEAARQMFLTDDADTRRKNLALIAASDFAGEEPYVKTYRLLLTDEDPTVRAAAAKALGMHGGVEDAPRLAALLADYASFVRWEASKGLQRIHNPADEVTGPLMAALADEDADVRLAAATALGQYPSRSVFQALVGKLTDTNFGVVHAATQSLSTLTGQHFGDDPRDWLTWAEANSDTLFAGQRPYTYEPYREPPGLIDKTRFWKDPAEVAALRPIGAE